MQITTDDETVYRVYAGGRRHTDQVYHTLRDCPHLSRATSIKEVPKESLWDDTDECNWCHKQRDV